MFIGKESKERKGNRKLFSCFLLKKKGGDFSPPRDSGSRAGVKANVGAVLKRPVPGVFLRDESLGHIIEKLFHRDMVDVGQHSVNVFGKGGGIGDVHSRENGPRGAECNTFFDYFRDIFRAKGRRNLVNA